MLSLNCGNRSTVASTPSPVSVVCATVMKFKQLLDACVGLMYATERDVWLDSFHGKWIILYAFCEFTLLQFVVTFGLPFSSVLYWLFLYQSCTSFAVLIPDASCTEENEKLCCGDRKFMSFQFCVGSLLYREHYVFILWRICPWLVSCATAAVLIAVHLCLAG